jgi:hypothetical protein
MDWGNAIVTVRVGGWGGEGRVYERDGLTACERGKINQRLRSGERRGAGRREGVGSR